MGEKADRKLQASISKGNLTSEQRLMIDYNMTLLLADLIAVMPGKPKKETERAYHQRIGQTIDLFRSAVGSLMKETFPKDENALKAMAVAHSQRFFYVMKQGGFPDSYCTQVGRFVYSAILEVSKGPPKERQIPVDFKKKQMLNI